MSRKTRVYFGFRGKARARAVQESPSISPHLLAASNGRLRPASVTDASTLSRSETSSGTSSQPNESASSLDDSDSKSDKTDHSSSSEESEKDCPIPRRSKGPPRKQVVNSSLRLSEEQLLPSGHWESRVIMFHTHPKAML